MGQRVRASITVSLDGYFTGPDDGPGCGLGVGGERLHYWVFGGPWRYDAPERGQATGVDREWIDANLTSAGAVIAGRGTYEAAGHWGDRNPWDVPALVVTHRPHEQPAGDEFRFVGDLAEAVGLARREAGDRNVHIMGGGQVIRGALAAGLVDDLSLILAPVLLGAGKRLFDGTIATLGLEHAGVRQSPFATFVEYRVRR